MNGELESDRYRQRLARFRDEVTLYPVACEKLADGRSDFEWLDAVLAGGARIVQLRDKESSDRIVFEKALVFRRKTNEAGALLIVNNRVDIALMVGADGVHLGDTDLPPEAARSLGPDLIIGISCHTPMQAAAAKRRGASYFNIGPIFPTETKEAAAFLGPAAIGEFSRMSDLPFTVMGGIKLENVPALAAMGARRLAVVSALTRAADIEAETRQWLEAIDGARR